MSRRRGVVALLSVLLLTLVPTVWRVAAAPWSQPGRAVRAISSQSSAPQIDMLGQGNVDSLASSADRLRLERITLPALADAGEHIANGPEILAVESGQVNITDNFGFSSSLDNSAGSLIAASTAYHLTNPGPDAATLLRFSVVAGTQTAAATPIAVSSPAASPVASGLGALAEAPGETKVLLDQQIKGFPSGSVQLFLAKGTWDPGADSGALQHDGPVGIVVTDGALSVTSPSGLQGQLKAGRGAALPINVPLHATNKGDAQAIAFIFGVVSAKSALLATPAPAPTQTPVPMNTLVPTMVPSPTPTVAPTPTPSPTPVPTTKAGTILQLGQAWQVNGAEMTVVQEGADCCGLHLQLSYKNTSDQRADFVLPDGLVRMYDDERNNWNWTDANPHMTESRVILNPGETQKWDLWFHVPNGVSTNSYSANVFVAFERFGPIPSAEWGFTWNAGRILTLPPGAQDPTANASPGNTAKADSAVKSANKSAAKLSVKNLLLSQSDIPEGFALTNDTVTSFDVIANQFSSPSEATPLLQQWGWQEGEYQVFEPSNGSSPDGINYYNIAAHRFSDDNGASQFLTYYVNDRASFQSGVTEVSSSFLGDQSTLMDGTNGDGKEASVYVRVKNFVLRVSISSSGVFANDQAIAITKTILKQAGV